MLRMSEEAVADPSLFDKVVTNWERERLYERG